MVNEEFPSLSSAHSNDGQSNLPESHVITSQPTKSDAGLLPDANPMDNSNGLILSNDGIGNSKFAQTSSTLENQQPEAVECCCSRSDENCCNECALSCAQCCQHPEDWMELIGWIFCCCGLLSDVNDCADCCHGCCS